MTVNLTVDWLQVSGGYQINPDLVDLAIAAVPEIEARLVSPAPTRAADILALRGVVELVEQKLTDAQRDRMKALMVSDLNQGIEALDKMRSEEGQRLSSVLTDQLDQIAKLSGLAKSNSACQPQAIRSRLQNQISEILDGLGNFPEDRMAQEVALLVTKADIREEIDRLIAHEQAARSYLVANGAIGRKLDFLCQEFNREANTLCSKSSDVSLTQIGLDLKTYVERFREQIQNIE